MGFWFAGIKSYGPFEFQKRDRSISYSFTEQWIGTGGSQTAKCGVECEVTYTFTEGISQMELIALESSIGGSILAKDVASITSQIKSTTQVSTTLSASKTTTRKYPFPAPPCGSYRYTVYQKVRDFQFVVKCTGLVKRLFVWPRSHNFRELTGCFDVSREYNKDDLNCPCKDDDNGSDYKPIIGVRTGRLSFRIDDAKHKNGFFSFTIGKRTYSLNIHEGESVQFEILDLPKVFQLLSGAKSSKVIATAEIEKEFELEDLGVHSQSNLPA